METKQKNFLLTPQQTVGPYYSIGLAPLYKDQLFSEAKETKHIRISGKILDGKSSPIPDAVIEIWQADEAGNYLNTDEGFARISVNQNGQFSFTTIKPGAERNADSSKQAPHLNVTIFMRGALKSLKTRIYFEDEMELNQADRVLKEVSEQRKHTLIASLQSAKNYQINLVIQGENETVFFEY
ncbi:protocatechuate 3,4-dioxygenase subunit alpha [Pedobacter sp. AW1-32]|uniref:protocatechuate 3,4-dioxygenase subunit alpha n=1 Tax=Pedobacter sp. AW1-32 TaxID=3383026 RepID=UPI003FF13AE7